MKNVKKGASVDDSASAPVLEINHAEIPKEELHLPAKRKRDL